MEDKSTIQEEFYVPDVSQEKIDATIEKVDSILKKNFKDYISFGDGSFTITRGSSQVMIVVRPFRQGETFVEFIANIVTGAKITPDLMKFLLRKNAELHFGTFGLLFDDTISFSHSIIGTNLDENEFITSLKTVAFFADYFDDMLVEMAGGKRAADMVEVMEE